VTLQHVFKKFVTFITSEDSDLSFGLHP